MVQMSTGRISGTKNWEAPWGTRYHVTDAPPACYCASGRAAVLGGGNRRKLDAKDNLPPNSNSTLHLPTQPVPEYTNLAMDFLKSAVASAISKGPAFGYSFGDRVDIDDSIWTLHNGTKRVWPGLSSVLGVTG